MDPRLVLIGALVGLLVGVSGVGGSSLMAPLLILVVRLNPVVAVGTDLLYSVPTKLLGSVIHWRQGTVDRESLRWLALGGVPGALLGILLLAEVQHYAGEAWLNAAVKRGVGVMLLVVAVMLLATPSLRHLSGRTESQHTYGDAGGSRMRLVTVGAVVGVCVSLTSIGSGALTVPLLYLLAPALGLRRVVGSNIAFAAILVPVATLGHLGLGHANVAVSANLLVGSLPGVFAGSRLCMRLPELWLRPAMAGILAWAGVVLV